MVSKLHGKVCAIFGGSRGIGKAISEALAIQGGNVAVISRDKSRAAECVDRLRRATSQEKHLSLSCDISCYTSVQNCFKDVQDKLGQVSILVNVAGINYDSLLLRMDPGQMEVVINTNLVGAMYTSQAVLKHMLRERDGVIINIGSVVGMKGNTGQCVYAASKAGNREKFFSSKLPTIKTKELSKRPTFQPIAGSSSVHGLSFSIMICWLCQLAVMFHLL